MDYMNRLLARVEAHLSAIAAAVVLTLSLFAARNPAIVEFDPEESVNAGQALVALSGHSLLDFFRLQYASICGGCSVDAALGIIAFSILPPTWMAWKMVAVFTCTAFTYFSVRSLHSGRGAATAAAMALLLIAPPWKSMVLSLTALGNHQEVGMLVTVGFILLAYTRKRFTTLSSGVILGFAMFVGWTAVPFVAAAAAVHGLRRGLRSTFLLAAGIALGLGPGLSARLYVESTYPIRKVYGLGMFMPDISRIVEKLDSLFRPALAPAMFEWNPAIGRWVGLACVASLIWSTIGILRRRCALGLMCVLSALLWACAYLVVDFSIETILWGESGTAYGLRYMAPLFPLSALIVASEVGHLWTKGAVRAVVLLMLPWLITGWVSRVTSLNIVPPATTHDGFLAVDPEYIQEIFAERFSIAELERCDSTDPKHRELHAWGLAWRQTKQTIDVEPDLFNRPANMEPHPDFPESPWWEAIGVTLARYAGPGPDHPTWHAERMESWLKDAEPHHQERARRAFWWIWVASQSAIPETEIPTASLNAYGFALGRRNGSGTSRFRPVNEVLPELLRSRMDLSVPIHNGWREGLGHALGENWGPACIIHTRDQGDPVLLKGCKAGIELRWLRQK
jgi:hypothetical protein